MTKEQPRAICSGRSKQKSDCERFAKATLLLRVTWANLSCHSQKREIHFKKFKKNFFSYFFDSFSPFLCQRVNSSFCSSLSCSFFKDRPWANCSGQSDKKTNLKRFAPVALYKRATGGIHFFPERIALSLTKNEQIAGKTNERIPNIDLLRLLINILKAFQIKKKWIL